MGERYIEEETGSFKKLQKLDGEKFLYFSSLTHEGPERHVSCLARHYFANARKMLWSCEG